MAKKCSYSAVILYDLKPTSSALIVFMKSCIPASALMLRVSANVSFRCPLEPERGPQTHSQIVH